MRGGGGAYFATDRKQYDIDRSFSLPASWRCLVIGGWLAGGNETYLADG